MKINKTPSTKKKLAVLTVLIILLVGGIAYGYYRFTLSDGAAVASTNQSRDAGSIDYGTSTQSQIQNGASIKQDSVTKPGATSGTDTPNPPSAVNSNGQKNVGLSITAANQNGSVLQIRTQIDIVDDSGTCTLILTNPSKPSITQTSGVQALATTSTCKGFDVSDLSAGTWGVTVSYNSAEYSGSVSQNVTVR